MQKSFFLITYIHKDGIQRRHDLFHAAVVDIAYREIVLVAFLAGYFLQPVILCQCYRYLMRLYVHNQFAFHTE